MWNLGDVYQRGEDGVEKDLEKSFAWFRRGAEAGDADAMESLGLAYLTGDGTAIDEEKAKEWLIRATENGNASAECTLGSLYARDDYWDEDLAEAVKWWERAAEHGDVTAMQNLGCIYSDPDIKDDAIHLNLEKAREWFRKAVDNGCEDAMVDLGLDVLGSLGRRYETYADWAADFKALYQEKGLAARILRKAGSWFQRPLDAHTKDADLAGVCLRWLARLARYQEKVDQAKELYRKAAEQGDEKAKAELAEICAGGGASEDAKGTVKEDRPAVPAVSDVSSEPAAPAMPEPPAPPSVLPAPPVAAPVGDETNRAEALFLRKARRFKKTGGLIDESEEDRLRKLAEELGISALRREELIEQVEEEFEAGM